MTATVSAWETAIVSTVPLTLIIMETRSTHIHLSQSNVTPPLICTHFFTIKSENQFSTQNHQLPEHTTSLHSPPSIQTDPPDRAPLPPKRPRKKIAKQKKTPQNKTTTRHSTPPITAQKRRALTAPPSRSPTSSPCPTPSCSRTAAASPAPST